MTTLDCCIFEGIASILCSTTLIYYYVKDFIVTKEKENEIENENEIKNENIKLLSKENHYNLLQKEKFKFLLNY
jgi:hypothetical protein